jgi:hypothetical protein
MRFCQPPNRILPVAIVILEFIFRTGNMTGEGLLALPPVWNIVKDNHQLPVNPEHTLRSGSPKHLVNCPPAPNGVIQPWSLFLSL